MQELHVDSRVTTLTQKNTADFAFDGAARDPQHVALRRRVNGQWCDVSSKEFLDEVVALAKGVIAAGIESGDRVAVMSKTRYEWTLVDFALFSVGAVVVPIYETSSAEQVDWICSDSGAKAIFVETDEHRQIVKSVRDDIPTLELIWTFEDDVVDELTQSGTGVADDDVEIAVAVDLGHRGAPHRGRHGRPRLDHLHVGHHRAP